MISSKSFFVFGQQPELVVFAGVDGLKFAVEDGPADVGGENAAAYLAASVADDQFIVPDFDALFLALFEECLGFARDQRLALGLKEALRQQLRVLKVYFGICIDTFSFSLLTRSDSYTVFPSFVPP